MTCKDAIALLSDYLEQALDADVLAQLDAHLADCPPCRAYLATFKRTRDLVAAVGADDMPVEMKRRLRTFLLEQLDRATE